MSTQWDIHYKRSKSVLIYPDENLVRMIKSYLDDKDIKEIEELKAIDLGCGTGRHLKMLNELGIRHIIGLDYSINALKICKDLYKSLLVHAENKSLPFKDSTFDIVVSWGSLHYSQKDDLKKQVGEINRIMKNKGRFFGTLRSERDTYLKKGKDMGNGTVITDLKDIEHSIVSFYSEEELKSGMDGFKNFEYGVMERSIIGDLEKRISHWFFQAEK